MEFLTQPWPWYIAGPLIGLMVPLLLLTGNKKFGISSTLRQVCAAFVPAKVPFLHYDWKSDVWNLYFVVGIGLGGFLAATFLPNPDTVSISESTRQGLQQQGFTDLSGLVPVQIFSWSSLGTLNGLLLMIVGGFLVGFGSRYAGGCTSGHAIMGLSSLQPSSLIAVLGFFAGGLFITYLVYPILFR